MLKVVGARRTMDTLTCSHKLARAMFVFMSLVTFYVLSVLEEKERPIVI